MKKSLFELFLQKLLAFPLWVKQVIYQGLYEDLSKYLSQDFIPADSSNIFHLYRPILSFLGKTELNERNSGLDENLYNFLHNIDDGLSMLEITMNNFFTMEESAKLFMLCIEQNYIKTPESTSILAMAGFISGKYRTGEYFKRNGKIDIDQLEAAIVKQKESVKEGHPLKMAEILISMGLVTEKDTKSLLFIKEESQKRFIIDSSILPQLVLDKNEEKYKDEVAKLKEQNALLKEQMKKFIDLVKKNEH